jgi:hypothetical protein
MKSKLLKLTVAALMVCTIKTQAQVIPPATFSASIFVDGFESWAGSPLQPTVWQQAPNTTLPAANCVQTSSVTSAGATPLVQSGAYSCNLQNTATTYSFTCTAPTFSVTAGTGYAISYYVRGKGDITAGIMTGTVATGTGGAEVVDGKTWYKVHQTVIAPTTTNNAQFYIKVKETGSYSKSGITINGIDIDSFVVQPYTPVAVSNLYSIQYGTNANGDSPYWGQSVGKVGGIVTAVQQGSAGVQGYYVQNSNADAVSWAAMSVYDMTNAALVHVGDSITFGGAVDEFFGMTQMSNITNFVDVSTITSHTYVINPLLLTTTTINQEMYESMLVELQGAVVNSYTSSYGQGGITDASGTPCIIDLKSEFYAPNGNATSGSSGLPGYIPVTGQTYCFIGNVEQSFGWNIEPRDSADIHVGACSANWGIKNVNNTLHANVYPNPANNQLTIELANEASKINVSFTDVLGKEVYTVNNLSGSKVAINDISSLPAGVYMVKIVADGNTQITKVIKQ